MKITIINTSYSRGGAAIAARRLFLALKSRNINVSMLVRDKPGKHTGIKGLTTNRFKALRFVIDFAIDLMKYIIHARSREMWFSFSPGLQGTRILKMKETRESGIIHLHWINNGFVSLNELQKLAEIGKPIVWTLHDMWPFTGGCHYPGECDYFKNNCGNCQYLMKPNEKDLSYRLHERKKNIYRNGNFTFVAVSNWMADAAKKSSLIGLNRIEVIPNPIDTNVFTPGSRISAREFLGLPQDSFLILSGSANLKDKRKGLQYLLKSLELMVNENQNEESDTGLVTFGKSADIENCPVKVYAQSYLKDEAAIARLYQAADVYILPSLEDNLPGTIMEALSCGTPVIAFKTGGIPDMIDHLNNGYLAELKSVEDLLNGIRWVRNHPDIKGLKEQCRKKVIDNFTPDRVADLYLNLYKSILK